MKKLLFPTGILAGFTIGAAIGFMWSTEVKKNANSNVVTKFENGKAIVIFDAANSTKQAIKSWL